MLFRANLPHSTFVDQAIGTHGQGSPAELYARKGLYTHMVDLQSASQNWMI